MLPKMCQGLRSLDELRAADWLSWFQAEIGYDRLAEIDRLAPAELELPNGNRHALMYEDGKAPVLAVRIQELFGVRETPRVGGGPFPRAVASARSQSPAAAGDERPGELLAEHVSKD